MERKFKVIRRWLEPAGVDRTGHQIFSTRQETIDSGLSFEEAKNIRERHKSNLWKTEIVLSTRSDDKQKQMEKENEN